MHPSSDVAAALAPPAIHQAGHAVMDYLVGNRVVAVIVPSEQTGSRCWRNWSLIRPSAMPGPAIDEAKTELVAKLAGPVAEKMVTGAPTSWEEGTLELVRGICSPLVPAGWLLQAWVKRVRRKVAEPPVWRAVEALANRLQQERSMSGEEVRRLLEHALPSSTRWRPALFEHG